MVNSLWGTIHAGNNYYVNLDYICQNQWIGLCWCVAVNFIMESIRQNYIDIAVIINGRVMCNNVMNCYGEDVIIAFVANSVTLNVSLELNANNLITLFLILRI